VVANQGAAEFRLPPDELDAISFEGFSVRARCSEFLPFPHQLADPVSQAIDIGLGMDGGHLQRMRLSPCSSHVESARKSPEDADEFPTAPVWKTRGLWKVRQYQIATEEPDTTSGGSGSERAFPAAIRCADQAAAAASRTSSSGAEPDFSRWSSSIPC
jgi:hypothetical protein